MLRTALDQMRHFLWFYFQVVDNDSDFGQKLREALQQRLHNDGDEARSFLERMTAATDEAFQRHVSQSKRASRTRPCANSA